MRATLYPTPGNPYYTDYALPDAVYRERYNTAPMPGGLPRRTTFAGLGAIGATSRVGTAADPIARFGRQSAAIVMQKMRSVPHELRTTTIKATLDAIEPGLADKVSFKAAALRKTKGYPAAVALEKALAATFANRAVNQAAEVGRSGKRPLHGLLGLGSNDGCECALARLSDLGYWGEGAVNRAKNVGEAIAKAPLRAGKYGVKMVKKGAKATASAVRKAGKAAKDAIRAISKGACRLADSGALETVGPAAAAAGGAPQASQYVEQGAKILKGLCASNAELPGDSAIDTGGMAIKVVAVGGGLALLAFLL